MHGRTQQRRLFYRLLVSYIAMLCLPVIVLGFFVQRSFLLVLRAEVEANAESTLRRIAHTADVQVEQLRLIAFQIQVNRNLRPFQIRERPYPAVSAQQELQEYATPVPFIGDILLHFRGDNFVISPSSTYEKHIFGVQFDFARLSDAQVWQALETLDSPEVWKAQSVEGPAREKEDSVVFLFPLSWSGTVPYGAVAFVLGTEDFHALAADALTAQDARIDFIDPQGSIVTSAVKATSEVSQSPSGQTFTYSSTSPTTGWTYRVTVPLAHVTRPVASVRRQLLLGLLIIATVGATAIYLVMHLTYDPIRELKSLTRSLLDLSTTGEDEIRTIQSAISRIADHNRYLSDRLSTETPAIRSHYILKLIRGGFATIEAANAAGRSKGIELTGATHFIILVRVSGPDFAGDTLTGVIDAVERGSPAEFRSFGRELLAEGRCLFLISSAVSDRLEVARLLSELRDRVSFTTQASCTIGAGSASPDLLDLGKSYIEASTALDYRFVHGDDRLLLFDDVNGPDAVESMYPYSDYDIERLRIDVLTGDRSRVDRFIVEIVESMRASAVPLYAARLICFDLINAIVKTWLASESTPPRQRFVDVFQMARIDTIDELSNVFRRIGKEIAEYVHRTSRPLIDRICSYLQIHYPSAALSLQSVADEFETTPGALSKYFREKKGTSFWSYVSGLRLQRAVDLLVSSDVDVKEIVWMVGYSSASSFIRKFRTTFGVTPAEYRKVRSPVAESSLQERPTDKT